MNNPRIDSRVHMQGGGRILSRAPKIGEMPSWQWQWPHALAGCHQVSAKPQEKTTAKVTKKPSPALNFPVQTTLKMTKVKVLEPRTKSSRSSSGLAVSDRKAVVCLLSDRLPMKNWNPMFFGFEFVPAITSYLSNSWVMSMIHYSCFRKKLLRLKWIVSLQYTLGFRVAGSTNLKILYVILKLSPTIISWTSSKVGTAAYFWGALETSGDPLDVSMRKSRAKTADDSYTIQTYIIL